MFQDRVCYYANVYIFFYHKNVKQLKINPVIRHWISLGLKESSMFNNIDHPPLSRLESKKQSWIMKAYKFTDGWVVKRVITGSE